MQDSVFDSIVGDFYRAATGAIEWDQALIRVQEAFSARAATLQTLDIASGQLLSLHGGPDLADAFLDYIREYHLIDPRRRYVLELGSAALGQWHHCHETFNDEFAAHDRFYQHYLPAYGSRFNANVIIPIADTVVTGFTLELPGGRGPLNPDEREVARRLGNHLREAIQAHQRSLTLVREALAGHLLLQSFPYPMWLIDESRFITFENQAAVHEVEKQDRVARRGSFFVLTRGQTDLRLTEQIEMLKRAGHGATSAVELRTSALDRPSWLHLSVLVPGSVFGAFGQRPQILATLFDPAHVSALDTFALANMFGLSPTESKVAARLADGLSADQIGAAHGTSEATVRTQIKKVIEKLGASRTVDVVRMLRQGEVMWAAN